MKTNKSLPVLADQELHQLLQLVGLATGHNELLQVGEVFGFHHFLVLSILADEL